MSRFAKYALTIVFGSLGLFIAHPTTTMALAGSDWKAGRIIDDPQFYQASDLSIGDIQGLLASKVPVCDTNGNVGPYYDRYGTRWNTRADYGRAVGSPPPYTCLKDYATSFDSRPADSYCQAIAGGTKSAATIIYEVSNACGISAKALIVMLEKEQGLVSDDWPWNIQYRGAMGYGCPDTAPCDAQYYGLFNQVYNAARQFKLYAAHPTEYRYKPFQTNFIYWNPNAGCGGTDVYVENKATAGLYNYTPYQPNTAALNNLYGSGDGCSAYGNRNFWRLYSDWFGSTYSPNYAWQPVSQEAYVDQTKTTPIDTNRMVVGNAHYFVLKVKNTGNRPWKKGVAGQQVNLGTQRSMDRHSSFCDGTWLNPNDCNRIATTVENEVAPGQTGTFEFWMKSSKTGTFDEYLNLVADGTTWLNDPGLYWTLRVEEPRFSWQPVSQQHFTDSTKTTSAITDNLAQNQRYFLVLRAKNTGNQVWKKGVAGSQVNVGTWRGMDRRSAFCDSTWLNPTNCDRTATMLENEVAPGQTGTFEFWITTPGQANTYSEYFNLVADGRTWLNDPGLYWTLRVASPNYAWQPVSQEAYVDQTKTTPVDTNRLVLGNAHYFILKAKNTGNTPWKKGAVGQQVNLGTQKPMDRRSSFCDSTWLNTADCNRITTTIESEVLPGHVGTFEFWMKSSKTGTFDEYLNLVADGTTWLNNPGLYWTLRVTTP